MNVVFKVWKPIIPLGLLDIPGSENCVQSDHEFCRFLAGQIIFFMKIDQILVGNASRNERHFQSLGNLLFHMNPYQHVFLEVCNFLLAGPQIDCYPDILFAKSAS